MTKTGECVGVDPLQSLAASRKKYDVSVRRTSGVRYITSDPIGLEAGLNTYGYVDANPLKYIDPKGLSRYKICEDYGFILKNLCKACVKTACGVAGTYCCKVDLDNCLADAAGDMEKAKDCVAKNAQCLGKKAAPKPKTPPYEKPPKTS